MKRKMASLDDPLPIFLIHYFDPQESYSNIAETRQMTGAEHQIADLDLLVRYSFYPHLNFVWSSSQRDCIGHHEQPRFLHNGRPKTRAPVIIGG